MQRLFLAVCFILRWTPIADGESYALDSSKTNESSVIRSYNTWTSITSRQSQALKGLSDRITNRLPSSNQPMECDDDLFRGALSAMAHRDLEGCVLGLAFDKWFLGSGLLKSLLQLPHIKQVVMIREANDFLSFLWHSKKCRGYFFLLNDPKPLLSYASAEGDIWDYLGKFVLVGLSREDLNELTSSAKGKKTQHIIGLVPAKDYELSVYMNQLFWGKGVVIVNRWRAVQELASHDPTQSQEFTSKCLISSQGFSSDNAIFPDKTRNLRGADLSMVLFELPPNIFYDSNDGTPSGRDLTIAEILSQNLNFSLNVIKSPAGEYWGYPDANGTWNGMTGLLQRNEAHFGLTHYFITDSDKHTEAVDFSVYYDVDASCFLTRIEPPLPRWQSLASPFQRDTWLSFLIGFFVFCPILYLLVKATGFLGDSTDTFKVSLRLIDSCMYTMGLHLRSSQTQLPKQLPTRVWILFLWLYAIILTTGYSCNLTAFLTVERPRRSMETIQELHASDLDVISICCFYKVSLEKSGNIYLKGLASRDVPLTHDTHLERRLARGEAVFIESRTFLEYLIISNFTRLGVPSKRIIKECYASNSIAIALQNNFPLKKSFDRALSGLVEHGLPQKWFSDSLQRPEEMYSTSENSEGNNSTEGESNEDSVSEGGIPLSIDHMQGIFYIYFLGVAIASFVLIFERYT